MFTSKDGDTSFVCSSTRKDGKLRQMIYNKYHPNLLPTQKKVY